LNNTDAPEGALHLVKKVDGTMTSLWTSPRKFDTTHEYLMIMDLVGGQISCWVDREQLCTIQDSDLANGQVGPYTAAVLTTRFAESRVGLHLVPPLPLTDGLHLLTAGASKCAPPRPTPPSQYRPGRSTACRQAWRAGMGTSRSHRRRPKMRGGRQYDPYARFLPAADYPVGSVAVLCKADGTGVFLVPTGGATLDPGTYRLDLIYRRDNTAHDTGSPVLSRARDKNDEHAMLDLPWDA
jgi:hypothetical protein